MSKKSFHVTCENCGTRHKSLFSDLGANDLQTLDQHKNCLTYKKGQIIFYEGTRPMGLYCINYGKVKVYKTSAEGKDHIISFGKPGDFLGYRALLSEEFYAASAQVIQEAAVCYIPKKDFFDVLQKNQGLFARLAKDACHKLGIMEDRLLNLAQKTVRERLASTLIMLRETYGMEGDESFVIDLMLTREDLANIVGTATETLIRLLSEFRNEKIISFDGKKIVINNMDKLLKEADLYHVS